MVAPTRVGWTFGTNAGGSTVALTNPAGAQAGDRVVAFLSHTGAAATITNLQGWTLLSTLTFNTRRWHILERDYASSYTALTLSTGEGVLWATAAFRATSGYTLAATSLGATWRRVDNGGSINTTQAPSMTAAADALALAFFSETSTTAEVEANTTLAGTGWSKWFWSKAAAGDANPINFIAYSTPSAGPTGTATTTWLNNSNNGAGVQLVIPQAASGPAPTGNLDTVGVFQHTATTLTVGARLLTSGTVEAVLKQSGVEVDRETVAFTSGVGNATFTALAAGTDYTGVFEVDGVVQTDVLFAGRTLRTGVASFTAVTGSCMFTGSTHPIFDRIADDDPDFWTIQGDSNYADPTTEAAWWDGMVASLNAFRSLPRKMVTRWTPDNHDTIRTTPLGGGAPALPPAWKRLAGANGWASSDSVGQAWQNGRVLFIQVDLRSARDNYQTDTAPLKLLGTAQMAWFLGLLAAAEADDSIALVVWLPNWIGLKQNSGRWGDYPVDYAAINDTIHGSAWLLSHVVMVGGDTHNLWADSGARSWIEAAFPGIPSLNMSGYNRAADAETFFIPDIANASLIASGVEADWGGYSRLTVDDDGTALDFQWDAVRVNAAGDADVMASWSRTFTTEQVIGTGNATLPTLTASGAGAVTVPAFTGAGAAVLPVLQAAGVGTRTVPVFSGTGAAVLPALQAVGLGSGVPPVFVAVGALVLPPLGTEGAGEVVGPAVFTGSGVMTVPAFTASGTGTRTVPTSTGDGTLVFPALEASGSGEAGGPYSGVGVLALPALVAAGAGTTPGGEPPYVPNPYESRSWPSRAPGAERPFRPA